MLLINVIILGGLLMLAGIIGGSTNALLGNVPLYLAGTGVLLMYSGVILLAARSLWKMDE